MIQTSIKIMVLCACAWMCACAQRNVDLADQHFKWHPRYKLGDKLTVDHKGDIQKNLELEFQGPHTVEQEKQSQPVSEMGYAEAKVSQSSEMTLQPLDAARENTSSISTPQSIVDQNFQTQAMQETPAVESSDDWRSYTGSLKEDDLTITDATKAWVVE